MYRIRLSVTISNPRSSSRIMSSSGYGGLLGTIARTESFFGSERGMRLTTMEIRLWEGYRATPFMC